MREAETKQHSKLKQWQSTHISVNMLSECVWGSQELFDSNLIVENGIFMAEMIL